MGQDSYTVKSGSAIAGMAGSSHAALYSNIKTFRLENDEDVTPGQILVQGTDDDQAALPSASTDVPVGIVTLTNDRKIDIDTGTPEPYGQNDLVALADDNEWYAYSEEAVAKGEQVYVRYASGTGGSVLGYVRNDADTTTCLAMDAKFAETITAAGPVKIRLNLAQV